MHEMERNILEGLITSAMIFYSWVTLESVVADSLMYLVGPLPETFCKFVIMWDNFTGIAISLCTQVICVLRYLIRFNYNKEKRAQLIKNFKQKGTCASVSDSIWVG